MTMTRGFHGVADLVEAEVLVEAAVLAVVDLVAAASVAVSVLVDLADLSSADLPVVY